MTDDALFYFGTAAPLPSDRSRRYYRPFTDRSLFIACAFRVTRGDDVLVSSSCGPIDERGFDVAMRRTRRDLEKRVITSVDLND